MKVNKDIALVKSQFMQVIQGNNKAVIWHSLFGHPKIVSSGTLFFLNAFTKSKKLRSVLDKYEFNDKDMSVINELVGGYYLIFDGFDERAFLEKSMKTREESITNGSLIDYLELIMSQECNFRCIYCMHFSNLEMANRITRSKKFMSFETAKEAINCYVLILRQHNKKVAEVNFGGGEPLLAWPVIENVLEYCAVTYSKEFIFKFSINTNASLITPEIASKLKEYRVEIASSLDGLRKGNDLVRLTKSGKGTFNYIFRGFNNLTNQHYPLDGIAVTVNEYNFPFLDERIIDWATEQQMSEVRIDMDVINMVEISVKSIVKKLMQLRQYAKEQKIDVSGFWSRPVENLNESTLDMHVAFCGAVRGNSICISPSGDIYGCGYSNIKLGTLAQIEFFYVPNGQYHRFVRNHLTGMMEMCKGCMIEGQCGGGCNITHEFAHATKTIKTKRMCDFYRFMTRALLLEQLKECSKFNSKGGENNEETTAIQKKEAVGSFYKAFS